MVAYWENVVLGHRGIFFYCNSVGGHWRRKKEARLSTLIRPWRHRLAAQITLKRRFFKCWETFCMSGLHCCVFVNCFNCTSKDKPPACQTSCLHTLLFIWWGDVKLPQTVKTGGNSKASMWSSNHWVKELLDAAFSLFLGTMILKIKKIKLLNLKISMCMWSRP